MWRSLSSPWQACLHEAWQSYCKGSVPVGAAVTDAEGNILARGRNRIGETTRCKDSLFGQNLAHAEVNALIALRADEQKRHTSILYSTMEPCPFCMGALYMSSVRTLNFAARDAYAGSTNMLGKTFYLSKKPIRVHGPQSAELEIIIVALHVEFELSSREYPPQELFDVWHASVPRGLTLGEELHKSGELHSLCQAGATIAEVLERLHSLI